MAKKQSTDPKTATLARIRRTEAYAEKVRLLFARTVNEILAINKTMPELDEGVMFSFDGTSAKKREQVETLLRRLHSAATLAIQKGVQAEWAQANAEADKLVQSVLGKEVLGSPQFTAYMQRNTMAMQAFIGRSEHGLNLSQRVWKPVRQLRDEMEVAMTVAIGEGESAADMSRKVRQYLNDPDLMFRRFRYKIGEKDILDEQGNVVGKEPVFGRKWKKRVIDPDTGRHKWIDYDRDSYPTGRGVYKSSAKNAMRVTRTETNIAYRRADNERWQQMDFVIGQRIQLSKNHPKRDICDKLQGEYPKDFQFDGWHPQCFCYVTPITIPPEETQRITEAFLKGEDWRALRDEIMRGRQITDYPANFKDWVTSHAEDIAIAREQGTAPYFIANNGKAIDGILNPDQAAPATTPAQAKAQTLNQLGKAAKAGNLPQAAVDKLQHIAEHGTQEEFERRAATLQAAAQRHAQRTPERKEFLRDWWDDRKEENRIIKLAANNIVKVANDYVGVDANAITAVENALNGNNLDAVRNATRQLAQKVLEIKKQEQALADLIPNAHQLHHQFSIKQLQDAHAAIKKTFERWTWDFTTDDSLNFLKGRLEREISIVEHSSHATKDVAKQAFQTRLDLVNKRIAMKQIGDTLDNELNFAAKTRSKVVAQLGDEIKALLNDNNADLVELRTKATALKSKVAALEKQAQARARKANGGNIAIMSPNEIRDKMVELFAHNGVNIRASEINVVDGAVNLTSTQFAQLGKFTDITSAERNIIMSNSRGGYIGTSNSFTINGALRDVAGCGKYAIRGKVRGNPNLNKAMDKYRSPLSQNDITTIETLDAVIGRNTLPFPIRLTRNLDGDAMLNLFGIKPASTSVADIDACLRSSSKIAMQADCGFMSTSALPKANVFGHRKFTLEIEVPSGANVYVSHHTYESECILGRETPLQYISHRIENGRMIIKCRVVK